MKKITNEQLSGLQSLLKEKEQLKNRLLIIGEVSNGTKCGYKEKT